MASAEGDIYAPTTIEEKPKLWTTNYVLIWLSTFTIYLSFYCLISTLPIYMETYGTPGSAGWPMAALTISSIICRPFVGWALDQYGRRLLFIGGLVIFLLPSMAFTLLVTVTTLIILRVFQGVGWSLCNTASGTVASDIVPKARLGEGMGFFSVTLSASMAIAPAVSFLIINTYSFNVLFKVSSALCIISIILSLFVKYPTIPKKAVPDKLVFMEKDALSPALVIIFVTFTYGPLITFLPVFALHIGLQSAGIFFTMLAIGTFLFRPISGLIVDRMGDKGYDLSVILGTVMVCISLPILAQSSVYAHIAIGGLLYGTGFGFIQPTMMALCIRNVSPDKKGAANATFWIGFDIGIFSGSLFWGYIVAAWGYSMMFRLNIIPAVIAMVIYFLGKKAFSAKG